VRTLLLASLAVLSLNAQAGLRDVDFTPRPGAALPLNVELHEGKRAVRLDRFFGGAPVVVQLGYFGCVNLCSTTFVGTSEALSRTGLVAGRDYVGLFVSIDPRDEHEPPYERAGWHILTGARSAGAIARAVGFRYAYEAETGQYAHPAGFVVATPEGAVSSYFGGVRFDAPALRAALLDASGGRSPGFLEQALLVCFHDPVNGRYNDAVLASLRILGGAFLLAAAWLAWRKLR
jgi:protein SCO1/2